MIDLTRLDHIKGVQVNIRTVFDSPQGKEVMKFLEEICGWYDFNEVNKDIVLMQHGKRQVLATIKTLLEHPAEHIHAIARNSNA